MLALRTLRYSRLPRPTARLFAAAPRPAQQLQRSSSRGFSGTAVGWASVRKPFLLADIGEGITECEIVKWLVTSDQVIDEFDPIVEVMSDKATVEITSPYSGKVSNLCGAVGDVIRVGGILCEVEMETEGDSTPTPAPALSPAVELPETVPAVVASTSSTPPAPAPSTPAERRLVSATPATRRLSREHSIDLQAVDGTGKDGRVTKGDVLAYVSALSAAPTPSTRVPSLAPTPTPTGDAIPLSPLRKAMYRAMSATLQTPHFAYSETIDVTALERLRLLLNRSIPPQYLKTLTPAALSSLSSRLAWGNASAVRVPTEERYDRMTLLPLLLKALSSAMSLNPLFLCTLSSSATPALLPRTSHDISLALSAPTGGLFTPLLPSVDTHSPFALASQIAHLQHLSTASSPPKFGEKYSGTGTITLSNVGVVGGRFTHPIIPPTGQLAIGAMGRMRVVPTYVDAKDAKKVAVEGGDSSELRMEPRLMMDVTFSADHRVVEGVELAKLVESWKQIVEEPARLSGLGR